MRDPEEKAVEPWPDGRSWLDMNVPQEAAMAEPPRVSFWERGERQQVRRALFAIVGGLSLIGVLGLVAVSPAVLYRLGIVGGEGWERVGVVGDAYGAAAALLSAVSLIGIAVSLLLGVRDSRTNRAQAVRTFHFELIRMQLDDPDLLWANGWPRPEMRDAREHTAMRVRQHLYANLWVYFYLMQYELRVLSEENLRALLANELFNGEVGRQYWASTGCTFAVMKGRRVKRFFRIVEEEYQSAVRSDREPVPAGGPLRSPASLPSRRSRPVSPTLVGLAGMAAGLAAGTVISRRGRA